MRTICGTIIAAVGLSLTVNAAEVMVDFDKDIGPVKPVNGVGQPPMMGGPANFWMMHYLGEAGIPFSRLHDVHGAHYVDIPKVFPDFSADETDPANYDFAFTDKLLLALNAAGVKPYYRLGVTIENHPQVKAYHIFPPKDCAKWARICEHVMAHYLEGWADGPKVDVSHWEIWNEADFHPESGKNQMWQAPFEEYIRLYIVAAKHLKARFPQEKIGGFGSCGFYHAATGDTREQAIHHMKCIEEFLSAVKREKAPLDFFSYHSYAGVADTMKHAKAAREYVDKYGFNGIELSLNEWLPHPRHEKLGSAQQAAEIAAEMIGFQNGPVDSACIYDARCGVGNYSPLFNPLTYKPHKAYYAFTAFNELRKAGTAVLAKSDDPNVWVAAAKGEKDAAVMLANDSDRTIPLSCDFKGRAVASCRITDKDRTDAEVQMPGELPPHSFVLLKVGN